MRRTSRAELFVVVTEPGRPARLRHFTQSPIVVGRGAEAELRLSSTEVSNYHGQISFGGEGITFRDNGSRNGSRIGGMAVPGRGVVDVAEGGTIHLGDARLVLTIQRPPGDWPELEGAEPSDVDEVKTALAAPSSIEEPDLPSAKSIEVRAIRPESAAVPPLRPSKEEDALAPSPHPLSDDLKRVLGALSSPNSNRVPMREAAWRPRIRIQRREDARSTWEGLFLGLLLGVAAAVLVLLLR